MRRTRLYFVIPLLCGCMHYPAGAVDEARIETAPRACRPETPPEARGPVRPSGVLDERIRRLEQRMDALHCLATRRPVAPIGVGGTKETDETSIQLQVLADQNRALRQQVEVLEASNLRLGRKVAELRARLSEVKQQSGVWSEQMGPLPKKLLPKFLGVVIGVGDGAQLAVINIGKEEGVEVGAEFLVFRGTRFVGLLAVEKVRSRQSVCRVFTASAREKVEFGDQVR